MEYTIERRLAAGRYIELLNSSGLGERRPVDAPAAITQMPEHANPLATAWDGDLPAGAARCLTGFACVTCCSDLCVRGGYHRQGIGKELPRTVLRAAPCRIVLPAAPKAVDSCARIGFTQHPSAWTILPGELR